MAALGVEQKQHHTSSTLSPTSGQGDEGAYYGFGASPKPVQPFRSARSTGSGRASARASAGAARGENIRGKPLGGTASKTRRPENISYDRRVKRSDGMEDSTKFRGTGSLKKTSKSQTESLGARMAKAKPPPPTNNSVDLTPYLVEQSEPPSKLDEETEVDEFLEQDLEPTEKHVKRGVDAATQIEPTDLWDFDVEVEPLLQVIVGKTLEQGMREVSEEDELSWLKHRGYEISAAKKKEVENVESLEQKAKSYVEQKNEKLRARKQRHKEVIEAKRKIASFSAARRAIASAKETSIMRCKHSRHLVEPEELVFEGSVAEDTYSKAVGYLHERAVARAVVDSLAKRAVQRSVEIHEQYVRDKEEAKRKEAEREHQRSLKRKYKIRITIHPPKWLLDRWERHGGEAAEEQDEDDEESPITRKQPKSVVIGPIPVRRMDSVATVQEKLREEVLELVSGRKELPEQDTGDEESPELGNIQWLNDVDLQLFIYKHALDPSQTLESYKKQDLLKGLGVRVVRKEPASDDEEEQEGADQGE